MAGRIGRSRRRRRFRRLAADHHVHHGGRQERQRSHVVVIVVGGTGADAMAARRGRHLFRRSRWRLGNAALESFVQRLDGVADDCRGGVVVAVVAVVVAVDRRGWSLLLVASDDGL